MILARAGGVCPHHGATPLRILFIVYFVNNKSLFIAKGWSVESSVGTAVELTPATVGLHTHSLSTHRRGISVNVDVDVPCWHSGQPPFVAEV